MELLDEFVRFKMTEWRVNSPYTHFCHREESGQQRKDASPGEEEKTAMKKR